MVVTEIIKALIKLFTEAIPNLIAANGKARDELIGAVSSLAAELEEGLTLVETYLRLARLSSTLPEAKKALVEGQQKLLRLHSEFKICERLRITRDRFGRAFDPLPASVSIETRNEIVKLLSDLGDAELVVIREFSSLWGRVHDLANSATRMEEMYPEIDKEIIHAQDAKMFISESARKILDRM